MYRVLFHLNKPELADPVLRNIENVIRDLQGEDLQIKLVVHSQGVFPFTTVGNPNIQQINKLIDSNVEINICLNTMKSLNLSKEDFPFDISIVSSGIGELLRFQKEGWLYIKP